MKIYRQLYEFQYFLRISFLTSVVIWLVAQKTEENKKIENLFSEYQFKCYTHQLGFRGLSNGDLMTYFCFFEDRNIGQMLSNLVQLRRYSRFRLVLIFDKVVSVSLVAYWSLTELGALA